ncbi:MAG: hypothetical protein M3O35_20660 [Acidobacteriota bacterium]|nr:hypothetical protein [Acidobacteriota bacterium]
MLHRFLITAGLLSVVLASSTWAQNQTLVDLRTQTKSVDFSGANTTRPFKTGTPLPATCAVGEMFYKSDAPPGANLYGCTSLNNWTLQSSGAGSLPSLSGNAGKVLSTDGSSVSWGALAGDVSGAPSTLTVTQIQGRAVSSSAPGSGQALVWNTATSRWEPQTLAGGGGGGGVTLSSQLGDLATAFTNATTLTIGANCSLSTPCNVRFGDTGYSFVNSATVTLSSGTGTAFIYVARGGVLTVGHNLTVNCSSACAAQPGVTQFPSDSIPLASRTATNGSWDATGGLDRRAFQSAKVVTAGAGLITAETSGTTAVSVDVNLVGLRVAVPATSAAACTTGSWSLDPSFYYICVATNTWRRTPLSSF